MQRLLSVLSLAVAAASLTAAPQGQKEQPEPKMEGLWNMTWAAVEGKAGLASKDLYWTIDAKGNGIRHYGTDPEKDASSSKFTLVFDHKNRTVDIKEGERVTLGRYELSDKDNTLTLCFNYKSKERPRFIDSGPQYGYTCYEFKRVAAKK